MSTTVHELALPERDERRLLLASRVAPLALVLLTTLVFLRSLRGLLPLWFGGIDSPYGSGPLLALVSVGLLWRAGAGLDLRTAQPSHAALGALALIMVGWVAACVAEVSSAAEALWPLAAWLVVAAVLGLEIAKRYLVPLGLLYLALPVWSPLVDYVLWPLAVAVPALLLRLIGTPVFVDGREIHVPEGAFEVAAGCTGLNFFLAASVVGILAAYLSRATWREWIVLLASSAVLAMIANWLRIAAVVYAGHVTAMQHPWVTVDHRPLGWTIFTVMILIYCLALRRTLPERAARAPLRPRSGSPGLRRAELRSALLPVLLVLVLAPAWVLAAERLESVPVALPLPWPHGVSALDARDGRAERSAPSASSWQPHFAGAALTQRATYDGAVGPLYGYENAYGHETPTEKLIYYWNSVASPGWRTAEAHRFEVRGRLRTLEGNELEALDGRGDRWLLRYSYAVGGHYTASPIWAKALIAAGTMVFAPPARGLVASAAPCAAGCTQAERASAAWWQALGAQ